MAKIKTAKKKMTSSKINQDVKDYVKVHESFLEDYVRDITESNKKLRMEAEEDELDLDLELEEGDEEDETPVDDLEIEEGEEMEDDEFELEEADDPSDKEIEDLIAQLEEEDESPIDDLEIEEGEEEDEVDMTVAEEETEDDDEIDLPEAEEKEGEEEPIEEEGESCDYKAKYESLKKKATKLSNLNKKFRQNEAKLRKELALKTKTMREATLGLYSAKVFNEIVKKVNLTKEQQSKLSKAIAECSSVKEMNRIKESFIIASSKNTKYSRAKRIQREMKKKRNFKESLSRERQEDNVEFSRFSELIND